MQTTGHESRCGKCAAYVALTVFLATTMAQAAGEDISVRIEKAVAVLDKLDDCLGTCLRPEEFARVDCAAIIPHFYRGAAVSGEVFKGGLLLETSFGRGFISCRLGDDWSAPAAVTMNGGSRAIQIGENLDVVILWINKQAFSQSRSHRSAIDLVAASASANGNSLADPKVKILIWGSHGKMSAGIDLQGAVLQPDDSVNKALYGKCVRNAEIVARKRATPACAQPMVSRFSALFRR
jgi:lipid-binding SYLF domain-containing protein